MKKTILFLTFTIGIISALSAQITGVKYLIEYNNTMNLYDCKIVISGGEATSYPQRIQMNSQYTIVVPTGTELSMEERFNPLEENQFYTGTVPCLWEFGIKEFSPPTQPQDDFHTVWPNLSPPSAYNDIFEGDTITLFSVSTDLDPCDNLIRLFENGVDPGSLDMPSGGDFSNGFIFGVGGQVYESNLTGSFENYISQSDSLFLCPQECITFEPNLSCLDGPLKYEWSTGDTIEVIEVCPIESEIYYLLVKDTLDNILDSLSVYIDLNPLTVQIQDAEICVNTNTVATANIPGGTWQSNNPMLATIDSNTGVITGSLPGNGLFNYTAPNGCTILTDFLEIIAASEVDVPPQMCVGATTTVEPSTGGNWESSDSDIATITNEGILEAINPGSVDLIFNDLSTGCLSDAISMDVLSSLGTEITGPDTICTGDTTTILPSSGGNWALIYSSSASVASINNSGIVEGLGGGKAVFRFISNAPGCGAIDSDTIFVHEKLDVSFNNGMDKICIGETTNPFSILDGSWVSNNPDVATIESSTGTITAVGEGLVTFTFTDLILGCSATTKELSVGKTPDVSVDLDTICSGSTAILSPDSSGVWMALNPEIASVAETIVTGESDGVAGFIYTSDLTGCVSDTVFIYINPRPETTLTGPNEICIASTTTIEPSAGGNMGE